MLTNVWGRTLGQLIYEVDHDVRELLIQSAESSSIGDAILTIYAHEIADHLESETMGEKANFLAMVHHNILSIVISNAQEPTLRAILQECPPSVLANMIRQHDMAKLLQVLDHCEADNIAQIVMECSQNTQANFLRQQNNFDISHTIGLMIAVTLSNFVQQLQMPQQQQTQQTLQQTQQQTQQQTLQQTQQQTLQQTQQQTQPTCPRRSSRKWDLVDYSELNEYGKKRR